jgi:uncharacterized RDD family membrane protein YckC
MEKYQTFWRRFWASLIDSLILLPLTWLAAFVFSFIGVLAPLLAGFVSVFYYVLMHFYYGQTVGKMALKVKVVDDFEAPINLGQSLLRNLPQLFPVMFAVSFSTAGNTSDVLLVFLVTVIQGFLTMFSLADMIVCLANEKRRALHDFIAGTVVIRTDV